MKLKNTPWTCEFEPMQDWHIKDNSGYWFALAIEDEETARAIAALPETLKRLERLEEAANKAILQIDHLHKMFSETASGNSVLLQLKKALEE